MSIYWLILLIGIATVTAASTELTDARKHELIQIYHNIPKRLKKLGYEATKGYLYEHAEDLAEAVNNDLVRESLTLFIAFNPEEMPFRFELLRFLAEKAIGPGNRNLFSRQTFDYWGAKIHPDAAEHAKLLVSHGLAVMEDFWIWAMETSDEKMFSWLLHKGANLNHRIVVDAQGQYSNLLGMCLTHDKYDWIDRLLDAGASVNEIPQNYGPDFRYQNLWQFILDDEECHDAQLYKRIVSLTDNILPFPLRVSNAVAYEVVDDMLAEEVVKRLEANRINLSVFQITTEPFTILQGADKFPANILPKTAALLTGALLVYKFQNPHTTALANTIDYSLVPMPLSYQEQSIYAFNDPELSSSSDEDEGGSEDDDHSQNNSEQSGEGESEESEEEQGCTIS